MRIALLLGFVSLAAAYTDVPTDAAFYDSFLKNPTAIKEFFGCLLDKNPCDDFGSHSKNHFKETVQGHKMCDDCSPVQKHVAHVMDQLLQQDEYRPYFDEFEAKYDPDGKYFKQFDESVKNY